MRVFEEILILSGVPLNHKSNGASFVNTTIIDLLSKHFRCHYLVNESETWTLYLEDGLIIKNNDLSNLIQEQKLVPLVVVQLHSWYPEIFRFFAKSVRILVLHSIKKESFKIEKRMAASIGLTLPYEAENAKIEKESQSIFLADYIVTVSDSERTILKRIYGKQSLLIQNPFDPKNYKQTDNSDIKTSESYKNSIVVLGRLDIRKPIHLLIKGFKKETTPYNLIFLGYRGNQIDKKQNRHNSYLEYCQSLITDEDQIFFLPDKKPWEIKEILEQSYLAIAPSIYDSFGYATLEVIAFANNSRTSNRYGPLEISRILGHQNRVDFSKYCLEDLSTLGKKSEINSLEYFAHENFENKWMNLIQVAIQTKK